MNYLLYGHSLLSVLFYQTSWSDFPHKFSIKRPGLFQVLSALVIENQGNLKIFERVSIKRPVLHNSFSNPRSLKQPGLIIETIE